MKTSKALPFFGLALTVLLNFQSSAQVQTLINREMNGEDWYSSSLNLKKQGILMYGWDDKTTFSMKALDTALKDYSSWTLSTEKSASLADIAYNESAGQILILMKESKTSYGLTTIDIATKKKKTSSLEIPKGTQIRQTMYVTGEEIWLVGYTKKEYFMYRTKISSPRLSPLATGISALKYTIADVTILNDDEVSIGYFYGSKKAREFDVTVLNSKGKAVEKTLLGSLTPEDRQLIIDASVTRLADGDYALTGTYNKKGKGAGNGVYFARYKDGKVKYFSNFDYSDFSHFFDHLTTKSKEKLEAKIEKKKNKGKEVTISHLSVMHRAQVTDDGLIFVGEYYEPTYRTEYYYTTGANGQQIRQSRRVFDGYLYTNAMAIGIDNNGKKLFDLNIPLYAGYKPMYVKKFLRLAMEGNTLKIIHTSGRFIFASEIANKKIVNHKYEVVNEIPKTEKAKYDVSNAIYWYGPYFFIMEKQITKEKGLGGKKSAKFFTMKVELK